MGARGARLPLEVLNSARDSPYRLDRASGKRLGFGRPLQQGERIGIEWRNDVELRR